MQQNYESVPQRARRLRVTTTTIYQQLAADRIPGAVKVGRAWRIPIQPTEPQKFCDWKAAQAGDRDED